VAVQPLEADDVRGQLAAGIQAQALVEEAERRLAERAHRLRDRRRHLALQVDEAAAALQASADVARGLLEDGGQALGEPAGVVDARANRVERLAARGHGQHLPVAIEDGAALGLERDLLGMLVLGQAQVVVVAHHLEDHQPCEQPEEGAGHQARDHEGSRPQAARPELGHGGGATSPRPPARRRSGI
jgi:hypothetical protein